MDSRMKQPRYFILESFRNDTKEETQFYDSEVVSTFRFTDEMIQEAEDGLLHDSKTLSLYQRGKLNRDIWKNWDIFYMRNEMRFFKDRSWIQKEMVENFQTNERNLDSEECENATNESQSKKVVLDKDPVSTNADVKLEITSFKEFCDYDKIFAPELQENKCRLEGNENLQKATHGKKVPKSNFFFPEKKCVLNEYGHDHDDFIANDVELGSRHKNGPLIVDVGCGVGNALIPLLKQHPNLRAIAFDVSERAIEFLKQRWKHISGLENSVAAAEEKNEVETSNAQIKHAAGKKENTEYSVTAMRETTQESNQIDSNIDENVVQNKEFDGKGLLLAVPFNISKEAVPQSICPSNSANFVLLLFVLSAIPPKQHVDVAVRCSQLLAPGGIILFRDYGRYDMAQMRFAKGRKSKVGENFYVRHDGTFAYFFLTDETRTLFCEHAGLEELENRYCLREFTNRKTLIKMRRVWVQAKFRKKL